MYEQFLAELSMIKPIYVWNLYVETSMYEPFMIDTCVRINLACIVIVNQIKL